MEITVKGKGFDITDSLRNHARTKLGKTTRFSDNVLTAEVTLSCERNWHIAKITLNCKGSDLHAEEKSTDMYNSIDRVVEKLERELKKQREKEVSYRGHRNVADAPSGERDEGEERHKDTDPHSPRIESVRRFVPPSMSTEEAIKEMESGDDGFYCFLNEDTGRFQIVYRQGRGFAVLEPRLDDN